MKTIIYFLWFKIVEIYSFYILGFKLLYCIGVFNPICVFSNNPNAGIYWMSGLITVGYFIMALYGIGIIVLFLLMNWRKAEEASNK